MTYKSVSTEIIKIQWNKLMSMFIVLYRGFLGMFKKNSRIGYQNFRGDDFYFT
jgi:hypothetical protein